MNRAKIPVAEYEPLTSQFNPIKFNAEEWVKVAKDAGMKYLVITSKHHDGFAMFDSKVGTDDIVEATPFKRDPRKELASACQKAGIKFGFTTLKRRTGTNSTPSATTGTGRMNARRISAAISRRR
jgi:alpha-L-fucosidase